VCVLGWLCGFLVQFLGGLLAVREPAGCVHACSKWQTSGSPCRQGEPNRLGSPHAVGGTCRRGAKTAFFEHPHHPLTFEFAIEYNKGVGSRRTAPAQGIETVGAHGRAPLPWVRFGAAYAGCPPDYGARLCAPTWSWVPLVQGTADFRVPESPRSLRPLPLEKAHCTTLFEDPLR
jgi:hypothetical protein